MGKIRVSGEDLGAVAKEERRDWTRGAARGGVRTRGRGGDERSDEVLAVEINDRDSDPERQAIFLKSSRRQSNEARGFRGFRGMKG